MSNGFSFDTTKFVLDEVKKEALKTAMEELAALSINVFKFFYKIDNCCFCPLLAWSGAKPKWRTKRRQIKCSYFSIRTVPHKILCK